MSTTATFRTCVNCAAPFVIAPDDFAFYAKLQVPEPVRCPDCRQQLRGISINHIYLFRRKCDATGQMIVSNMPPESPYKVYAQEYWYSDKVDNTKFGRDFDFSRPFFEQFHELALEVPRPALFTDYLRDENSAYTNYSGRNNNCYLVFDSDENRDCYYGYSINRCRDSLDGHRISNCELCYEAVDSRNCYSSAFLSNCENCSDSVLLSNCIGCRNCLMCCNLRQKEYHVFNRSVSKEEFERIRASLASYSTLTELLASFQSFKLRFPQKYMKGFQNENVTGNYLINCKNAVACFDCRDGWDIKYCYQSFLKSVNCMDTQEVGEVELAYECSNIGYNAYNIRFCMNCLSQITNLTYCDMCFNGCSDLFGCLGLTHRQHCILNKQYTPTEYATTVARIIEHMRTTGEWGQFFPESTAVLPYNLTSAHEFYPLTEQQVLAKGLSWREDDRRNYQAQSYALPDSIRDTSDAVVHEILACAKCSRNYKIIPQEFAYYRSAGLPLPRSCFECRHKARIAGREPRQLWARKCSKCATSLQSAYAPERPEIVYCEKCYLESLD